MDVTIIKPSSYRSMPWRNGLGTTVELAKKDLPGGNGFAWRLSMADVASDGAFSNFSGYDRTLLLLGGGGITLDCNDQTHRLEHPLQAARFRGEDPTFATLHDGPIKDFNIMAHRQSCTASVTAQTGEAASRTEVDAHVLLVYAVNGDLRIESDALSRLTLPAGHLLITHNPVNQVLHSQGSGFIVTQIRDRKGY
jgi:environmental stress-induced protein Ves